MARQSSERWAEIVADAEATGAPHAQVAAKYRVSLSALKYHLYRSRKVTGNGPRLLPVRVGAEPILLQAQCGPVRVAFPEGCSPTYVAAVLAALAKITC
jgi:hypothetical protein